MLIPRLIGGPIERRGKDGSGSMGEPGRSPLPAAARLLGRKAYGSVLAGPRIRTRRGWTAKTPLERAFPRLRGKDSNLDYLIQSQASYH